MLNNLREVCNHYHVTSDDYEMARKIIDSGYRTADLVIAPNGSAYLYRWHVVPQNDRGNIYFHIQVADDPKRPLHDHPWDNMSVILSGGYVEYLCHPGYTWPHEIYQREVGDVVQRRATQPHRLLLPDGVPYTMTLFSTGPKIRKWGFWYPEGWVDADAVCRLEDGISTHIEKEGE